MGEHVLPSKLISRFVCGVNKLHIPIIRVCPPQERVRSWHGMREHVLADKLISSFACRAGRIHILSNRVRNFQKGLLGACP